MQPDFKSMNETDVREIIVRPLLHRLGFKHGTPANIRTEVTLKYGRAFLGLKDETKDPPLRGRADYICEAISYGRWAVEVKRPSEALTREVAEQAHSYSAHPEIAASHFLLTNGREFRLYVTGELEAPLLAWSYDEQEQQMMTLFNVLGPEAIKRRAGILRADVAKPLGPSLRSRLEVIGGEVVYGEHRADHPLLQSDPLRGMVGAITGGYVVREDDGRIHARVEQLSPLQQFAALNKAMGLDGYDFFTAEEFISGDPTRPTILQNVVTATLPVGERFRLMPGLPEMPMPVGFRSTVFTEATGFIADGIFHGTLSFDYDYMFTRGALTGNPVMDQVAMQFPPTARIVGEATFRVRVM